MAAPRRRTSRHAKKKNYHWVKISLIIIVLLLVSGIAGYFYADFASKDEKKEDQQEQVKSQKDIEEAKRKEVHQFKVKENIPITDAVSLQVEKLETYTQLNGPKNPCGLVVHVINHSDKKQELPQKYMFDLRIDGHLLQSVGIYGDKGLEQGELAASTAPLDKKEKRTVVYLFSAKEEDIYKVKEAKLTIQAPKGKQEVTLRLPKYKEDQVSTSSEVSTNTSVQASAQTSASQGQASAQTSASTSQASTQVQSQRATNTAQTTANTEENQGRQNNLASSQAPVQNQGQRNATVVSTQGGQQGV